MSDTTSILELPMEPANRGPPNNQGNISLVATEMTTSSMQQQQQPIQSTNAGAGPVTLDQTTISQIVSGLQQASSTGATLLPSRDIPRNTDNITRDPHVQPNYIPQPNPNMSDNKQQMDYIQSYEETEDVIRNYNKNRQNQDSLDDIYTEIQGPLLLAVLYFLFQLPIFKKFLFQYFPALFMKDGNYSIYGFLFTSVLFGLLFYLLNKVTLFFNTF
jgi:hypothetical protein